MLYNKLAQKKGHNSLELQPLHGHGAEGRIPKVTPNYLKLLDSTSQ